ncbi:hypothetical protein [Saccharophagus degradans]|uniref:Heat shock protein DnaJ-like protein n=1 Tax=Saccharophagus degradans TaxID=86304 RepID=A0AAW7X142_9GAMM|nr:hypothetical protein [Saccharophagus degradans]MDO6421070.1 hypothetical protein [Saccharophagus degradans]MDO6606019.1 hypothetical protein [Saccharophagus degradans]
MSNLSKKPNKKNKKKKATTPEAVFSQLYAKIQRFQQQNAKLREHLANMVDEFKQLAGEDEKALNQARHQETLNLIRFISRKSLSNWQKETLIEWVIDNIHQLEANPFNDHEQIESLKSALTETLESTFGALIEPDAEPESSTSEEPPKHAHHNQDDLFDFDDVTADAEADDESFFYDEFDPFGFDFDSHQEEIENEEKAQKAKLDDLFKTSTVRKMFRQLSKQLHPDLEQDEKLKAEKHQQMTMLLEARRNHDVLTIFTMHSNIFGSNTKNFTTDEIQQLIPLLKNQLEQEQHAKENIIHEDMLQATIYDWFNAKTPQASTAKMKSYVKELKMKRQTIERTAQHITSIAKLKPYLEIRYDQAMAHHLEHMFFN